MARYDHLPIYRAAFDLAVHIEKIVRHFSRYHKYSLGTELRENSRRILERIIEANNSSERQSILLQLRADLEKCKMLARLCHESSGFVSTRLVVKSPGINNMSMGIERANIYQAIQTLPDNFLPELAEFIIFLHKKAQHKTDVWTTLSSYTELENKPADFFLQTNALEKAAQTLFDDYTNDKELTALLSLDGEDFHA